MMNIDEIRNMPVTAEWLREIGFRDKPGYSLVLSLPCSVSELPSQLRCSDCDNAEDTPWEIWNFPDDSLPVGVMIADSIPTRGQIMDLLCGLGIGTPVDSGGTMSEEERCNHEHTGGDGMTEDWQVASDGERNWSRTMEQLAEDVALLRRQNARQAETIEVLQIELQLMREVQS